jgi:lysophospholipase L1-like esterase
MNRRHFLFVTLLAIASPAFAADRAAKIRVACVGDSITYGSGLKNPATESYPAVLQTLLGPKYDVKNFGVSGATLLKKGDKPYDKQKAYKDALEFKPDILVIKLGTNDSKPQNWDTHKGDFAGDYKAMIDAFRTANPRVKVHCAFPVPVYPPGAFKIRDEIVKPEIIPQVRKVAEENKCEVIDLYAALSDKAKLFPDKVHPNAEGAALIAKAVHEAIK